MPKLEDDLYFRLKNQIKYETEGYLDINEIKTLLENDYQIDIENYAETDDEIVIDEKKEKPLQKEIMGRTVFSRDAKLGRRALKYAKYECEVDKNHPYFKSRKTLYNYVEAHHLIPMEYQSNFDSSIDIEANIVSLCPYCHKLLHHGEMIDTNLIIRKLYSERADRLKKCGVYININELLQYYK